MEEILKFAKENNVPVVRPLTLQLLIDTIKKCNPKNILEIGTRPTKIFKERKMIKNRQSGRYSAS